MVAAILAPLITIGVLAQFDFADAHPVLFAITISATSAFLIGLRWPRGAWLWGLWVASGFGLMLIAAFVGLLKIDRADPHPLIETCVLAVVSCGAGAIGGRLGMKARGPSNAGPSPR